MQRTVEGLASDHFFIIPQTLTKSLTCLILSTGEGHDHAQQHAGMAMISQ